MDLLTFDSKTESETVLDEFWKQKSSFNNDVTFIGGVANDGDWFWTDEGKKIDFNLRWAPGKPRNDLCLGLKKDERSKNFSFDDVNCSNVKSKFLCQARFTIMRNCNKNKCGSKSNKKNITP